MDKFPNLLDLPEDIILQILSHLNSFDVVSCSFACEKLCRISHDKSLWIHADFITGNYYLNKEQAKIAIDFLHSKTQSFHVKSTGSLLGERSHMPQFSLKMLHRVKKSSRELRSLRLENWNLELQIQDFPSTLLRLSVAGSKIKLPLNLSPPPPDVHYGNIGEWYKKCKENRAKQSYFYGMHLVLPRLQSLDLTGCTWVSNHSLLSLSKCQFLREISLNSCKYVGSTIAYSALAGGMGFKSLERFDIRCTAMEDMDLKNFMDHKLLTEVYVGQNVLSPDPKIPLSFSELDLFDKKQTWPQTVQSIKVPKNEDSDSEEDDDEDDDEPQRKIKKLTYSPDFSNAIVMTLPRVQDRENGKANEPQPGPSNSLKRPRTTRREDVWSEWEEFNEDNIGHHDCGMSGTDAFEDVFRKCGGNVIVLNLKNNVVEASFEPVESFNTTMLGSRAIAGSLVTDNLVRDPISKNLQVLCVAGCNITDKFFDNLLLHDLKDLRLIDVRDTNVTAQKIASFKLYCGDRVRVLASPVDQS